MKCIEIMSSKESKISRRDYLHDLIERSACKNVDIYTSSSNGLADIMKSFDSSGCAVNIYSSQDLVHEVAEGVNIIKLPETLKLPFSDLVWVSDAGCVYHHATSVVGVCADEKELFSLVSLIARKMINQSGALNIENAFQVKR